MNQINQILSDLSGLLWGWPMIILLLGTHLFLTIRLRCPQRYLWTAIKLSVRHDRNSKGDVSQFGALATALAATIGTGNIVGVATAVALGGIKSIARGLFSNESGMGSAPFVTVLFGRFLNNIIVSPKAKG